MKLFDTLRRGDGPPAIHYFFKFSFISFNIASHFLMGTVLCLSEALTNRKICLNTIGTKNLLIQFNNEVNADKLMNSSRTLF